MLPRAHGGVHGRAVGELVVRDSFLQCHARLSVKLMLSLMLYDNEQYLEYLGFLMIPIITKVLTLTYQRLFKSLFISMLST